MKGQIVEDFMVDHAIVELSLSIVDTNPLRVFFDGPSNQNGTGFGS